MKLAWSNVIFKIFLLGYENLQSLVIQESETSQWEDGQRSHDLQSCRPAGSADAAECPAAHTHSKLVCLSLSRYLSLTHACTHKTYPGAFSAITPLCRTNQSLRECLNEVISAHFQMNSGTVWLRWENDSIQLQEVNQIYCVFWVVGETSKGLNLIFVISIHTHTSSKSF